MLTTHELLENAAKYSTDGMGQLHIELHDEPSGDLGVALASAASTGPAPIGSAICDSSSTRASAVPMRWRCTTA